MAECAVPQMLGNRAVKMPDLVLVAGGEGILGGRIFYELLKAEFNVRCILRIEDEERIDRKPGVEFFYCDPWDGDVPESAFEGVSYVINAVSPLNTGSMPSDDFQAFERLSNILITRSAMKHVSRYVALSSIFLSEDESAGWPYSKWRMELSARNSGAPFTILRSGIILDERNYPLITHLGSRGLFSPLFGRKGGERLFVTSSSSLASAFATVLRTDQALNRTYEVVEAEPLSRRDMRKYAAQSSGTFGGWEADAQSSLSSGRYGGAILDLGSLEPEHAPGHSIPIRLAGH